MARFNIVEASALDRFQIVEDENGAYYSTNTVGDNIMKISPAKEMLESVFFDYSSFFDCNDLVVGETNIKVESFAIFLLDPEQKCYFCYTPGILKRNVVNDVLVDSVAINSSLISQESTLVPADETVSFFANNESNEKKIDEITSEIDITLSNLLGNRRDEEKADFILEPLTEEKVESIVVTPTLDTSKEEPIISQFIEEQQPVKEGFWKKVFSFFQKSKHDSPKKVVIQNNEPSESIELPIERSEIHADNSEEVADISSMSIKPNILNSEMKNNEILDQYLADKITFPFRQNMKISLDKIKTIIISNLKSTEDLALFEDILGSLKSKLGISQDLNRVQQMIDNKSLTEAKLSIIEGKELSLVLNEGNQDDLVKFKDLIATYDKERINEEYQNLMFARITNLSMLETAKRISLRDEATFNSKAIDSVTKLFATAFTKEIAMDLESLRIMSLRMNISDTVKKQLIDEYHQIDLIINIYRKETVKYNAALQTVNNPDKLFIKESSYLKV